jgi:hypothetical protein
MLAGAVWSICAILAPGAVNTAAPPTAPSDAVAPVSGSVAQVAAPTAAVASAAAPASPTSLERQSATLIDEITASAAVEPAILGIDTQIRAASILSDKDAAHAVRFLGDAGQRALHIADPATRARFLKDIVDALAPLDAGLAESFCASQSRRPAGQSADPLAACYDQLLARTKDWSQRKELLARAQAAGAYALSSTGQLLRDARDHHAADFAPLLASVIGAFPERPEPDEIAHLESIAVAWRRAEPALARQAGALCQAARAARRENGAAATAKTSLIDTNPLLAPAEAENANGKSSAFNFNFNFDFGFGDAPDDPGLQNLPDVATLPTDEAIRVARSQGYAGARAGLLGDLLDDRGGELDPPRWAALAEEAIRETTHMRSNGERLILQANLARACHQHGERALAAAAAQALVVSFDAWMACGEPGAGKGAGASGDPNAEQSCSVFRIGGSPGEVIMTFAEYLWKAHIEPGELGLQHPGLHSRWLLLELRALYEGKPE